MTLKNDGQNKVPNTRSNCSENMHFTCLLFYSHPQTVADSQMNPAALLLHCVCLRRGAGFTLVQIFKSILNVHLFQQRMLDDMIWYDMIYDTILKEVIRREECILDQIFFLYSECIVNKSVFLVNLITPLFTVLISAWVIYIKFFF